MSNYGFNDDSDDAIQLPTPVKKKTTSVTDVKAAAEAGKVLGFVSREGQERRKTGPKQTEPQGKLTLTGPERVLRKFQDYCDKQGGVSYWQGLEALLEKN